MMPARRAPGALARQFTRFKDATGAQTLAPADGNSDESINPWETRMNTFTSKNSRFNPLMALLALAPFAVITPSQAAGTEPLASDVNVSLADLDLSTPEGVNIARDRLHLAARRLCFEVPGENPAHPANFIACMNDTVTDALRQIDQPGRAAIEAGSWTVLPGDTGRTPAPTKVDQTGVRVVSLAHVDLSTAEGAQTAKERVTKAARHLCAQLASHDSTQNSNYYAKCVADSTLAALRQIPTPAMAALQDAPKARIEISTQVASK
jgi:UrcA family protein